MTTATQAIAPDTAEVAIGGYSPVSYFDPGRPERGSAEFAVVQEGRVYHLASAEQVATFRSDPEKYVPAFGGWCAFGMSMGERFPIDPETFKIAGGRLMLFLRNEETDARDLWNKQDEGDRVSKADRSWQSQP